MSMRIEFEDDYNQTTYYFGTLEMPESSKHSKHRFTVEVAYFSNIGKWTVNEIIWDTEPVEEKNKAENRITNMVNEWHGKRCDIDMVITAQDPGDEND